MPKKAQNVLGLKNLLIYISVAIRKHSKALSCKSGYFLLVNARTTSSGVEPAVISIRGGT